MRSVRCRPCVEPIESRLMCDASVVLAMGCAPAQPLAGPNEPAQPQPPQPLVPGVPDPADTMFGPLGPVVPSNPTNIPFLINLGANPVDLDPMDNC